MQNHKSHELPKNCILDRQVDRIPLGFSLILRDIYTRNQDQLNQQSVVLIQILIVLDITEYQRLTCIDGRASVSFEQPHEKTVLLSVI